ncbi:hypothetical protein GCM10010300_24090 [Streptomyces olivaceoviridis]|uniref:DUF3291 domain-containing protein n=1 Tax=Streptomyces olivaceoviridis TaxID=1921 RepID=UPI0019B9D30C|nr:hypothetical protein GCM10010300_24090 [Streptomyces olivaceoviridis]
MEALRRRREWFHRHVEAHLVLWWIPAGHLPTVDEALERPADLRTHGPSPRAFTFAPYTAAEAARDTRPAPGSDPAAVQINQDATPSPPT